MARDYTNQPQSEWEDRVNRIHDDAFSYIDTHPTHPEAGWPADKDQDQLNREEDIDMTETPSCGCGR